MTNFEKKINPRTTYLSKLLKHFPKVKLDYTGTPEKLCPHELGLNEIEDCGKTDNCCAKCWNQPLPEREEVKINENLPV